MKKIQKMIDENAIKTILLSIVSIFTYMVGEVSAFITDFMPIMMEEGLVDLILQRGARTVAVVAGTVAIMNGLRSFFEKKKKNKKGGSEN